jgi:hydroxyacylglutathione hydrolase
MSFTISPIKAFTDNYIWALHNSNSTLVVDPGDAEPVLDFLQVHNLELLYILITHHHYDHTGGIGRLIEAFPKVKVYGPDNPNIKGITNVVRETDSFTLPELEVSFEVLHTPGHTLDHIVFVHSDFIFCGDTLFSAGCGRMFEGSPEVFHVSLQKLAALKPATKVYCTHEYTQANIAFALSVDGQNKALKQHAIWVDNKRKQDEITLPSTIAKELEINPFLRCHTPSLKLVADTAEALSDAPLQSSQKNDVATFAKLRKLKDNF